MVSISSIDNAFEAIEKMKVGIDKCDSKYTMRNINEATKYSYEAFYEAGEDIEKTIAINERIISLINKFDTECVCHKT